MFGDDSMRSEILSEAYEGNAAVKLSVDVKLHHKEMKSNVFASFKKTINFLINF